MSAPAVAELNYERRGAGPPLVLLHGIGHRWQASEPVLDRLAAKHDAITVICPVSGSQRRSTAHRGRRDRRRPDRFFRAARARPPHVAAQPRRCDRARARGRGHVSSATALSPRDSGLLSKSPMFSVLSPSAGRPSCPCRCCTPWCARPRCGTHLRVGRCADPSTSHRSGRFATSSPCATARLTQSHSARANIPSTAHRTSRSPSHRAPTTRSCSAAGFPARRSICPARTTLTCAAADTCR